MLKLYRALLHLYPAGFREGYAKAMEQEFRAELAEAQTGYAVGMLCGFGRSAPGKRGLPW